MVAAETCDCTLCRPAAGCWVSGLYQRSTPLRRLAHTPTALYPSHLRRRQLIHNGNVIYYTKILAQKSMGFEAARRLADKASGEDLVESVADEDGRAEVLVRIIRDPSAKLLDGPVRLRDGDVARPERLDGLV